MAADPVTNFAKGTLDAGINASVTALSLGGGEGALFPQPSTDGAFNAIIYNFTDYKDPSDDPNKEIVRVTARSTDDFTIVRAQEGTSGATHNTGGKIYRFILAPTAKAMDDLHPKWVIANVAVNVSPAVAYTAYYIDASGAERSVALPDVSAGNDGDMFRIVLADNTNSCIVTTVSGTDLIGDKTIQSLLEVGKGITVQSNNTSGKYEIVQDSRFSDSSANIGFDFYLTDSAASGIGGYLSMVPSPTGEAESEVVSGSLGTGEHLIEEWATEVSEPTFTNLSAGVYALHFHAEKTSGNNPLDFHFKLFKRAAAGGAETELGVSEISAEIDTSQVIELHLSLADDEIILSDDRLVIKIYANVGSGGNIVTTIFMEGTTNSRVTILTSSSSLDSRYLNKVAVENQSIAAAINEIKASNINSATTTDIGAVLGNYVHITGVTTITGLGTVQAGTRRNVTFDGILTLTHHSTSLILPTGADIKTAAGDTAKFISEGSGNWRCISYQRKNGLGVKGFSTEASSATPTINVDAVDAHSITALGAAITSMTTNLSGTPVNFQKLIVRILDNGTARAITWGASFEDAGVELPTTTVESKLLTVGFIYDTVTSKWGCVAVANKP